MKLCHSTILFLLGQMGLPSVYYLCDFLWRLQARCWFDHLRYERVKNCYQVFQAYLKSRIIIEHTLTTMYMYELIKCLKTLFFVNRIHCTFLAVEKKACTVFFGWKFFLTSCVQTSVNEKKRKKKPISMCWYILLTLHFYWISTLQTNQT